MYRLRAVNTAPGRLPGNVEVTTMYEKVDGEITSEIAHEMAAKMIGPYLTADFGQRLVSDYEDPLKPYLQEQNTKSMAGEVFSVKCPGIGNLDMSHYREGWDCDHLNDAEVIVDCVENGDMIDEIDDLAGKIYTSANDD